MINLLILRGMITISLLRRIEMIYYISDSHFGDERVMRLAKRPFHSVNDMDDTMISLWNKQVGGTDVVYVVGDFAIDSQTAIKTLKQLNGQKILILGNHDACLNEQALQYFESTATICTIKDGVHSVTLCHYPLLSYENSIYNGYHVFGHIHNNPRDIATKIIPSLPRHLNCGADVIGFMPKTLQELIYLKEQTMHV